MASRNAESSIFRPAKAVAKFVSAVSPHQKTGRVIIYCEGGIAPTLMALLMHKLGYGNVAVCHNAVSE
jgi:hypothetical protein